MASKFCTLADVKPLAGVKSDWIDKDPELTAQIKVATALIRQYTRRHWERGVYTDYHNSYITLGGPLIITLDEMFIQDTPAPAIRFSPNGNFGLLDPMTDNNYAFDKDRGRITFYSNNLENAARSIQVIYTAGFAVDVTDTDLLITNEVFKSACALQAATMYKRIRDDENGKSAKGDKRGSAQFKISPSGLIPEVLAMMKPYVKLFVGR